MSHITQLTDRGSFKPIVASRTAVMTPARYHAGVMYIYQKKQQTSKRVRASGVHPPLCQADCAANHLMLLQSPATVAQPGARTAPPPPAAPPAPIHQSPRRSMPECLPKLAGLDAPTTAAKSLPLPTKTPLVLLPLSPRFTAHPPKTSSAAVACHP